MTTTATAASHRSRGSQVLVFVAIAGIFATISTLQSCNTIHNDVFVSERGIGNNYPSSDFAALTMQQCKPKSAEAKEMLLQEMADYEQSPKFQQKIRETRGEAPIAKHHKSIIQYLRSNVLQEGWSVLDLGAAAGSMLRYTIDAYNEMEELRGTPRGRFRAVELVPGWVEFGNKYFLSDVERFGDVSFSVGDATDFDPSPEGSGASTFDFVMMNDVVEHLQADRYPCLYKTLRKATHLGSVVYMHTPTPEAQLVDRALEGSQFYERVLPHHFIVSGMAGAGFELVAFEHDTGTICKGNTIDADDERKQLPKMIARGNCFMGQWVKYYHAVFVRKDDEDVFRIQ